VTTCDWWRHSSQRHPLSWAHIKLQS
jgi:hypothetical protein